LVYHLCYNRHMETIRDINLRKKRVLLRADFNVPVRNGKVLDANRIEETMPTIGYILENGARELNIISHLDRPGGKVVEDLRLKPVAETLAGMLRGRVDERELRITNYELRIDRKYKIKENLFLLENVRFDSREEENNKKFAEALAKLGDIFVFDAFGTAHREHASTVGIMEFLPSCTGLLVEKEVRELSELLKNPRTPFLVIIGGAKTEDKAPLIDNFLKNEIAQMIVVGGRTANLLLKKERYVDERRVKLPIDGLDKHGEVIVADKRTAEKIFDIGPQTISEYKNEILKARTLLLAGPMGKFEDKRFDIGTKEIFITAANSGTVKYAAGGETVEMIDSLALRSKFNFISTGGGAALEFLAGKKLPVISRLKKLD